MKRGDADAKAFSLNALSGIVDYKPLNQTGGFCVEGQPGFMLNPVASSVLVVSYLVFGLIISGLLGAVFFALVKLHARLDDFSRRLDPLLQKADDALTTTTETVEMIGNRAEAVLVQSEAAVETVHEKVDRTASTVSHVVNVPIIRANSVLAGVTQGFSTFARLQKRAPVAATAKKQAAVGEEK